ncbi:MAG TPA: hypothetical protein VJ835_06425, partial [Fimbriimonadaceae bacterium]|nr:hypothetical protein [Fimbriimonadaceae bacterium]
MKVQTRFKSVIACIAAVPICAFSQTKPAVQMPGDNGKVAIPYQMGKKGDELVFTLEKVEFVSRVLTKDREQFPEDGKRLLVVTYAVQNPSAVDRQFFAQSFSFTVVSPDDENFVTDGMTGSPIVAYHPDRRDRLSLALKPAQKVRAFAVIQIHPKGPVNKLIIQRGKGTPVLRYDLKDKVKPLAGAFSASKGLDILDVGVGAVAAPFDLG